MERNAKPGTAPTARCEGAGCPPDASRRTGASGPPARRRAAEGSRLCPDCRESLAAGLRRLPGLYEACGQLLGGGGPGGLGERTSGGPLPGMPFNTAAADARSAIVGVLGSWAGLITQTRGVVPPRRTVPELAPFLLRHADWLAAHRAAGDLSAEVARLVRGSGRLTAPAPRAVPVGPCPEAGCPGTLQAPVAPGSTRETPQAMEIRCGVDPVHRWAGHEWTRLSHRMREGGSDRPESAPPAWLTAAEISRLWDMAPGSVYRLANEGGWRRLRRGGRTFYHEHDVRETCTNRRSSTR